LYLFPWGSNEDWLKATNGKNKNDSLARVFINCMLFTLNGSNGLPQIVLITWIC